MDKIFTPRISISQWCQGLDEGIIRGGRYFPTTKSRFNKDKGLQKGAPRTKLKLKREECGLQIGAEGRE